MTSYKKLYEDQVEFIRKEWDSEYKCPKCGMILRESLTGIICSNENCSFEYSISGLVSRIAETNKWERCD